MKKRLIAFIATGIIGLGVFAGCGANKEESKKEELKIKVGATASPYGDMLEFLVSILEKEGVKLEPVVVDSFATLNPALKEGDIDANFFQHTPFIKDWSSKNNFKYYATKPVHLGPVGFFSNKISKIEDLREGAIIPAF